MPSYQEDEPVIKHWHLDKRIPLALIITIIIQTAAGFWWAATLTQRVSTIEATMSYNAPQADRLTRVEVKVDTIIDSIGDLRASLKKTNP